MQGIRDIVGRMMQPLSNKLRLMISRGIVKLINDATKSQTLQVSLLADEVRDDIERFEDYGLTSYPFKDAETIFVSVGGNRSHGIVLRVFDRRYRPTGMAEGDVCLFNENGERVYLNNADDIVHLGAKSAAEFIAQAAKTNSELDAIRSDIDSLKTAFSGWTPVPQDGGAALKTATSTWAGSSLGASGSVAATKVKAT